MVLSDRSSYVVVTNGSYYLRFVSGKLAGIDRIYGERDCIEDYGEKDYVEDYISSLVAAGEDSILAEEPRSDRRELDHG
jgi:hypothetical protein